MIGKNINRGFKKLRVWNDAISLYTLAYKIFSNFPYELKKVAANSIDAAHSISRNTRPVKLKYLLKYAIIVYFKLGINICAKKVIFNRVKRILPQKFKRILELFKLRIGFLWGVSFLQ